jgi:hypothetical protein
MKNQNEEIELIKKIISPTVALIKELNICFKKNEIDYDVLLKLLTTMKVTSIKLDKISKENNTKLTGDLNSSLKDKNK